MVLHYIPEELSKEFVINYNQIACADGQIEQKIQYQIGSSYERGIEMPDQEIKKRDQITKNNIKYP